MQAQTEIGGADDARVVLGLEPSRTQLDAPRRQAGEPPLELRAPLTVAGDEHDQICEAPVAGLARFPAADAFLDEADGIDDDVEVFVSRPARRADDEADRPGAAHAEPGEQRLPHALAFDVLDRRRTPPRGRS